MLPSALCHAATLVLAAVSTFEVFTDRTFDDACRDAEQQKKLVLVVFVDDADAGEKKLVDDMFADERVLAWAQEGYVACRATGPWGAELAKRFEVVHSPSALIVEPSGKVRAKVPKLRAPKTFLVEVSNKLEASDRLALAERRLKTEGPSQPAARLAYARALEEEGKIDKALSEYMSCVQSGSSSAAGPAGTQAVGARLVAIEEIARLSKTTPAARETLVRVRDECRARILGGTGGTTDPVVFTAASNRLDDLSGALDTYHQLRKESPSGLTGRLLRESIVDAMLDAKRYADIGTLIDVPRRFRLAFDQYQRDVARPVPGGADSDRFRAFQREAFVMQAVQWYEMLVGMERASAAAEVAEAMLGIDDTPATYHALAKAACRAGRLDETTLNYAKRAVESADPVDAEMVLTLVQILRRMDLEKDAKSAIDKYVPKISEEADRARIQSSLGEG